MCCMICTMMGIFMCNSNLMPFHRIIEHLNLDLNEEVKKVKETLRQIHQSPPAPLKQNKRNSYFTSPSFSHDRGQFQNNLMPQQSNFPSGNNFQLWNQQQMTSYPFPSGSPHQYFPSGNQFGYGQFR